MLSRRFIKWVIIANLLTWPVGWYIINDWMKKFAYHAGIGPEIFLFAFFFSILIAVMTIGSKTIAAARVNPVELLRYE